MRDRLADLGDAVVAVVTFAAPDRVARYHAQELAPLTLLVDLDRASYRAYGFGRGSLRTVWGPRVWAEYWRLLRAGGRLRRTEGDTRQLGGDVVVDRTGRVAYLHRSIDPADRPPVDDLVAVVAALDGPG